MWVRMNLLSCFCRQSCKLLDMVLVDKEMRYINLNYQI